MAAIEYIINTIILIIFNLLLYKSFKFFDKFTNFKKEPPKINLIVRSILFIVFFGVTCLIVIYIKFGYYFAVNKPDVAYLIPYFALYYFVLGLIFKPLNPLQKNVALTIIVCTLNVFSTLADFIGNGIYFVIFGRLMYFGALFPALVFALALKAGILLRAFLPKIKQKFKKTKND